LTEVQHSLTKKALRGENIASMLEGYEVNTSRVSDAIHYGCIPVVISNNRDLPFADVLDWSKFSVVINQRDIAFLKTKLLSRTRETYPRKFIILISAAYHTNDNILL
jgi:hypothetical protein